LELLGRRSPAPAQNIARRIPGRRRDPDRLLTLNGVTSYANDHYRLLGGVAEGFCGAVELSSTERDALTKARLGQGLFSNRVSKLEPACRVTGLARQQFLVASHIKPWRDCDNRERLSGANGLLLSPHVDKLFDRHWISFDSGGALLCEHEAARDALRCWGIDGANLIRPFSREQETFLHAHRDALRH